MTPRNCACCPNTAIAGKLLCEKCKDHAAELEHVRLGMAPGAVRIHGRMAGGKTLALASIGLALACSGPKVVPCDAHDHAAQGALSAELLTCQSKIDACETQACVDAVEADCNKAAEDRCKEPGQ